MNKLSLKFYFIPVFFLAIYGQAAAQILVGDAGGGAAYVNKYSAAGAVINSPLAHVQAGDLEGIAASGNFLFTADRYSGGVGEYNLTTGSVINATYISLPFAGSYGIAVSNNLLYVTNGSSLYAYNIAGAPALVWTVAGLNGTGGVAVAGANVFVVANTNNTSSNVIGEYNALTGATVSASLVTGLYDTFGITAAGNNLFTSSYAGGTVSEFTTTGQTVNANLITGIPDGANGLAVGGNTLYVADISRVLEYNVTTGAPIATITSGLSQANSVIVVPEPAAHALLWAALLMIGSWKLLSRPAVERDAKRS